MDFNEQPLASPSTGGPSPLNMGFYRDLPGQKKLRADGQPPKRRGPKPDSKPAQTRRQELNRQAQRTHRERKEKYVKDLEIEVQTMRPKFEELCQDLDAHREEIKRLQELLRQHGISFTRNIQSPQSQDGSQSYFSAESQGYAPTSSASSPPPLGHSNANTPMPQFAGVPHHQQQQHHHSMTPPQHQQQQQRQQNLVAHNIDYTQFAKDFVKSLELPCADHSQMLCTRALDPDADPSGHVLMATCPPREHCIHHPDQQYPHQLPDLKDPDLVKLFDLSQSLPDGLLAYGEISPIEAWKLVWSHQDLQSLSLEDLFNVQDVLMSKVRCYGYGAVLETFEIYDAVGQVVSMKDQDAQEQDTSMQTTT